VVSVFQVGAYFGCLFIYPVGQLLGRKWGLLLSGFFLNFGEAICLIANKQRGLGAIYAGRVISGLGVGGVSGLTPIYVSEIAPPSIRGQLVGFYEVSWQVGGIVGYWINYGILEHVPTGDKQWIIPFAVQLIPSAIFWIGLVFLPESPRWLFSRNRNEKAVENLSWLRRLEPNHRYMQLEMAHIEKTIEEQQAEIGSGFWAPFKALFSSKKLLYRLLLSVSMFPMQNGSGINAVTYYSPTVFKSMGITGKNTGLLSTGIFGVIKASASVVWLLFVVDNMGRRTALLVFSLPCAICMWYIGAYIKIADPSAKVASGDTTMDSAGRAALALFYIWSFTYGVSWNGTPWVYNSEIFPLSVRQLTQSINASSNWFWAFIFGRFTGKMFDAMGYGVFFLFASCMVVFPVVIFFLYPETKNVPLEAMDHLFDTGYPAWKARQHALEVLKVEDEQLEREPEQKHNQTHIESTEVA
jgi:sugar porter (SP) family MFS transporter